MMAHRTRKDWDKAYAEIKHLQILCDVKDNRIAELEKQLAVMENLMIEAGEAVVQDRKRIRKAIKGMLSFPVTETEYREIIKAVNDE